MPKRKRPQSNPVVASNDQAETPGTRRSSRRQAPKRNTQHSTLAKETTGNATKSTDDKKPPSSAPPKHENAEDEDKEEIRIFEIPFEKGKSITCEERRSDNSQNPRPTLLFTHGAGGGLSNPATQIFVSGFASRAAPVLTFQGTMNLKHRVRCFDAVREYVEENSPGEIALGGRSMGARAAVLTALAQQQGGETPSPVLVLVSYPLVSESSNKTGKEDSEDPMRTGILLSLPSQAKVLFVIGDNDGMCPLPQLRSVVGRMKAQTWIVVVEGCDHGMAFSSPSADLSRAGNDSDGKKTKVKVTKDQISTALRRATGKVAGEWVLNVQGQSTSSALIEGAKGRSENRVRIIRWDSNITDVQIGEWVSDAVHQRMT